MDKNERATLGPLIRAAREGREWTQEELAYRANTTRRTVGSIERGDTTGQVKVIERVLAALGVVQGLVIEPDVKTFVRTITPLLQRLSESERAQVMPAIVELVAVALERKSLALDANAAAEEAAISLVMPIRRASTDEGRFYPPAQGEAAATDPKKRKPKMGDEG